MDLAKKRKRKSTLSLGKKGRKFYKRQSLLRNIENVVGADEIQIEEIWNTSPNKKSGHVQEHFDNLDCSPIKQNSMSMDTQTLHCSFHSNRDYNEATDAHPHNKESFGADRGKDEINDAYRDTAMVNRKAYVSEPLHQTVYDPGITQDSVTYSDNGTAYQHTVTHLGETLVSPSDFAKIELNSIMNDLCHNLEASGKLKDFLLLCTVIATGKLDPKNIALCLTFDVARLVNLTSTTGMIYPSLTLSFWTFLYNLCGSTVIKAFSGPKNRWQVVQKEATRSNYDPALSKFNFAVPAESILRKGDGYIQKRVLPGMITSTLDEYQQKAACGREFIMSFDAKTVGPGVARERDGDVDLLGLERPVSLQQRLDTHNANLELCRSLDQEVVDVRTACMKNDGIDIASAHAWRRVADNNPEVVSRSIVYDNIDVQNVAFSKRFFGHGVENQMRVNGDIIEAEFVRTVRAWYMSCDTRGMSAQHRIKQLIAMHKLLTDGIDFDTFPAPGGTHLKGISNLTYEAILQNICTRIQMYGQSTKGTYNHRSVSTLTNESFFGDLVALDKENLGTPKAANVPRLLSKVCKLNYYKHMPNK